MIELDDKDAFILEKADEALATTGRSLLIFVYRKTDAELLAKTLSSHFVDSAAVGYFHAGLTLSERKEVAGRFREGDVRVLVTTTSLKMGVNTPATEVIVRLAALAAEKRT